jgi:hypothetical protein
MEPGAALEFSDRQSNEHSGMTPASCLCIRHRGGNRISRLADWLAAKANRWIPGNPGPKGHEG